MFIVGVTCARRKTLLIYLVNTIIMEGKLSNKKVHKAKL